MPMPMPMPMLRPEFNDDDDARATRGPAAPMGAVAEQASAFDAADSPARLLHQRLLETFAPPEPAAVDQWPGAVRLAVILGASLVLWGGISAIAFAII